MDAELENADLMKSEIREPMPTSNRECNWDDLDAVTGGCVNCGEQFWNAPDPTLAAEQHYR